MYVTNSLIEFLNMSSSISNSNIILTDLEKVIWVSSSQISGYLDVSLSCKLKEILNLYTLDISFSDYMNVSMDSVVPIVDNDDYKYISQIILPIVHNEYVDGLLIFTTEDRKYLPSNLKFAKTTKYFTEVFSTKKYLSF